MALNTLFDKPAKQLVTYRENTSEHVDSENHFGPPFDHTKYAQLDFWLTESSMTKAVSDVSAGGDIFFDSDHYILEISLEMKIKQIQKSKRHHGAKILQT